jgi:squalene synthase HpnC
VTGAAYDACARLAREHYENFPVASWMLPPSTRPHIAAIYAFARTADDFADEGDRPPAERLALLDDWGRRLHEAVIDPAAADGVFGPLAATIRERRLDVTLFDDLLSAFRQDVQVTRYERWEDIVDYARRSANPVGRLVLQVCGYREPRLAELSDRVCTALQFANFWQDVERDWGKGRVYVPAEIVRAAGADERDLAARCVTPEWRRAFADVVSRTRALFDEGRAIADEVRGRLRLELRATWLGGVRILDRLEEAGYDMFRHRPSIGWTDTAAIGWQMLWWRSTAPRRDPR